MDVKEMILSHIKEIDDEIKSSRDRYKIAELLKAKSTALLALSNCLEGVK